MIYSMEKILKHVVPLTEDNLIERLENSVYLA